MDIFRINDRSRAMELRYRPKKEIIERSYSTSEVQTKLTSVDSSSTLQSPGRDAIAET
jgi:hypothetical protein